MRKLFMLLTLTALALILCGPAQAGSFLSLGGGAAQLKGNLTTSDTPADPPVATSISVHPTAADVKIGIMLGDNLAVYGTAKACDFKAPDTTTVYSGLAGVGASLFLQGDGKGLYLTAAEGKALWYQKSLQDKAFEGNGTAVGVGLFLMKDVSLEATCIQGKTSGTVNGGTTTIATDTKTYMGTLNIKF